MEFANTRVKKVFLIATGILIALVVVVILLISPITKYLIEKYDVKYTGRQIRMNWVYVNPFTGYIHFSNLRIYEAPGLHTAKDGDTLFFSAKGLSVNFAMFKLLSKTIEISELTVDQPRGIVIQDKKIFNFTDLITKFTPAKPSKTPSAFHFNILTIRIKDGEFHYLEKLIPVKYFIRNVIIESTGKQWNSDTITVHFSCSQGIGSGDLKGDFTINFKTNDYRLAIVARKFDLQIIEQYLKELTNNASFSANLDANIKARGSFSDEENTTMSGQLAVNDFHFGKSPKDDLASFDKLVLAINEISPRKHKYLFDSLSLQHPSFKYERYDNSDNLQAMFGKNGARITAVTDDPAKFNLVVEIARYVKVLAKNFFQSDYRINRLAIYRGDLKYNDFAITEKFSAGLNPLLILADSIDNHHKQLKVSLTSGIVPYGSTNISLGINPKDSSDFDLKYHIQKVPLTIFNPYLISYTSYPVDRGTLELRGNWTVRKGFIQSANHLVIIDPRAIRRIKNKGTSWIPLRWIMSLVRERGNVIDYDIPITGNLKDPKFHLHDVLIDLLTNIFVKPATASYRMEVKNVETEIEDYLSMKWQMRQSKMTSDQEKFVANLTEYLTSNPTATIAVYPMQYNEKEKEHILFFEARKKYYLSSLINHDQPFTADDSLKIDRMPVKDSLFVRYLNRHISDTLLNTIQDKCLRIVGFAIVDKAYNSLNRAREVAFLSHFKTEGVANRVKIFQGENHIPYNGFSFYKITYKGELPKKLVKAYRRMNELNGEAPREKFEKEHKTTELNIKK